MVDNTSIQFALSLLQLIALALPAFPLFILAMIELQTRMVETVPLKRLYMYSLLGYASLVISGIFVIAHVYMETSPPWEITAGVLFIYLTFVSFLIGIIYILLKLESVEIR